VLKTHIIYSVNSSTHHHHYTTTEQLPLINHSAHTSSPACMSNHRKLLIAHTDCQNQLQTSPCKSLADFVNKKPVRSKLIYDNNSITTFRYYTKLETKAMPFLRHCKTGRTCLPLPITRTEKTSLDIHVQKIK